MGAIFGIIVFGLILVIGVLAGVFADNGYRWIGSLIAVVGAFAMFMLFLFGGMKTVPVKTIGIPQAFGAVSGGVMTSGVHFTFEPWLSVNNVDETVQTTTFEGTNALSVRIGGQQSALADATIQWQILPSAAESLYQNFANQGDLMHTITNAVVIREFKQVVNNELGDYNPITDVATVTNSPTSTSQFTLLSSQIQAQMQKDIGNRVRVLSVFLPHLTYDSAVEAALQAIQTSYANYAIAQENVRVNTEKAAAYAKLGTPSLAQLIAQCITEAGSNAGQCIPGSVTKLALTGK